MTFSFLKTSEGRKFNLPDSFLELLRSLDKQNRLAGSIEIVEEIAQDKFGKSLYQEDKSEDKSSP